MGTDLVFVASTVASLGIVLRRVDICRWSSDEDELDEEDDGDGGERGLGGREMSVGCGGDGVSGMSTGKGVPSSEVA